MFYNLLNSRLNRKLLGILFAHPKRSFYITELQEMTRSTPRMISRALRELTAAGILKTATKKRKHYFCTNPHFSFYEEVQNLVGEKFRSADEVSKQLKKLRHTRLVVLSGVFTFQPHLPVDFLIVGEKVNRSRVSRLAADLERLAGQEINYSVMNEAEFVYRRNMNDRFVRDVLDNPHLVVVNTLRNKRVLA